MHPQFSVSRTPIRLHGKAIAGAFDRQQKIVGFDQAVFSQSTALCIGAGGIISHTAATLARKGIGCLKLFDDDVVEPSNLNRQRFYIEDVGKNKARALAHNLQRECIAQTDIRAWPYRFEDALASGVDLRCDVAICGVDNNPARVAVSRYFRLRNIPVIFVAVSGDADHGYVFVQEREGPCIGCLFPDMVDDDRYPCPGTPAIADILQALGAVAVYAVDTLVMDRPRAWNYRSIHLSDGSMDGSSVVPARPGCSLHAPSHEELQQLACVHV